MTLFIGKNHFWGRFKKIFYDVYIHFIFFQIFFKQKKVFLYISVYHILFKSSGKEEQNSNYIIFKKISHFRSSYTKILFL